MRVFQVPGGPAGRRDDTAQELFSPDGIGVAADPGEHQFASRLRDTLAARHARQAAHQQDEQMAAAEVVHSARKAGGKHAEMYLGGMLDDDWMMIRGYRNSAGGIGQLLVGTHGVVAMTSLHLDATVHCHGDKWRAERHGQKGQTLGEFHLVDRDGRSPGTELNQAADALEQFLRSSDVHIKVQRVVLLNHPRSQLEDSRRASVQIFASHYDLADWLKRLPKVLDRAGRRQIERLLTRHEG